MSSIIKPRRSGGVIGTIGPIGGSGVFSLQERHALSVDNYDDVVLYLKMNGANGSTSFLDSSQYGHTVTANGDAQISTAESKFGGASGAFDGTGDFLSIAGSSAFSSTGDLTIEAWCYIRSASAFGGIFSLRTSTNGYGASINILSNGNFDFNIAGVGGGEFITHPVSLNQWLHVALVRSGSSTGNCRCYVNGTQVGQFTSTAQANVAGNTAVIGRYYANGANQYFVDGYIDDVRYTPGIARYGSFQPPAQAFPDSAAGDPDFADVSLLLHMDGADGSTTFTDSSSNGHTVTANGNAQISTAESKFGGASARLNGGSDRLSNASAPVLNFGTGDFTVEMWVNLDNLNNQMLLEGPSSNGFQFFIQTNQLLAGISAISTVNTYNIPVGFTGVWRHLAVCRSGSTQRMYVDGILVSSGTSSHNHTVTGFQISRTSGYLVYGYIDDLRITKGVARYTGSFTPPQREFLP